MLLRLRDPGEWVAQDRIGRELAKQEPPIHPKRDPAALGAHRGLRARVQDRVNRGLTDSLPIGYMMGVDGPPQGLPSLRGFLPGVLDPELRAELPDRTVLLVAPLVAQGQLRDLAALPLGLGDRNAFVRVPAAEGGQSENQTGDLFVDSPSVCHELDLGVVADQPRRADRLDGHEVGTGEYLSLIGDQEPAEAIGKDGGRLSPERPDHVQGVLVIFRPARGQPVQDGLDQLGRQLGPREIARLDGPVRPSERGDRPAVLDQPAGPLVILATEQHGIELIDGRLRGFLPNEKHPPDVGRKVGPLQKDPQLVLVERRDRDPVRLDPVPQLRHLGVPQTADRFQLIVQPIPLDRRESVHGFDDRDIDLDAPVVDLLIRDIDSLLERREPLDLLCDCPHDGNVAAAVVQRILELSRVGLPGRESRLPCDRIDVDGLADLQHGLPLYGVLPLLDAKGNRRILQREREGEPRTHAHRAYHLRDFRLGHPVQAGGAIPDDEPLERCVMRPDLPTGPNMVVDFFHRGPVYRLRIPHLDLIVVESVCHEQDAGRRMPAVVVVPPVDIACGDRLEVQPQDACHGESRPP